ncbi:MAG: hypothetical protein IPK83_10520 [Planctomycetes bacterium]|nr:hypothetical protein [Planctomycetota bacterium]
MSRSMFGYGHDKANRMTTQAAVSQGHDLRGNLTLGYSADRGSSYTYEYDHNNRLSGVIAGGISIGDYKYDALGRRDEYYDGANEIAEFVQSTIWGGFPPGRVVRRGFVLSPLPRLGVWRDWFPTSYDVGFMLSPLPRLGVWRDWFPTSCDVGFMLSPLPRLGGAKFGAGISPGSFSTHRLGCQVHGTTPLGLNGGWGMVTQGRSRARSTLGYRRNAVGVEDCGRGWLGYKICNHSRGGRATCESFGMRVLETGGLSPPYMVGGSQPGRPCHMREFRVVSGGLRVASCEYWRQVG